MAGPTEISSLPEGWACNWRFLAAGPPGRSGGGRAVGRGDSVRSTGLRAVAEGVWGALDEKQMCKNILKIQRTWSIKDLALMGMIHRKNDSSRLENTHKCDSQQQNYRLYQRLEMSRQC